MSILEGSYYRSTLSVADRMAYDALYQKYSLQEDSIRLPRCWTQTDRLTKIIEAVMLDHPSIFWVNYYHYSLVMTPIFTELRLPFFFYGTQLDDLMRETNAWQARIAEKVPVHARTVDRAWLIFDYLARQVRYGEQNDAYSHTIIGPMSRRNHTAVCEGVAKSYKFLCDGAGIPCIIVIGKAHFDARHSGPHAWNMVECEGGIFHVDVTAELEFAHYMGSAGKDSFLHLDQDMRQYSWNRGLVPRCD